jgi:ankyrin repeat protein
MWLIDRGADLNARCYLDLTPLSFAVHHGHPSTIEILLRSGDIWRGQLLHHAVERKQDAVEVLGMLLSRGASINDIQYSQDENSWNHEHFKVLGTPLHRAVELRNVEVAQYLLHMGADQQVRDTKHCTPLDIARHLADRDMIDLLRRQVDTV